MTLRKLQKEIIAARDCPLTNDDEYDYLDYKVLKIQKCIDDKVQTWWYLSVLFLTTSLVANFISIFKFEFVYVSLISFILWMICGIYALYIKHF